VTAHERERLAAWLDGALDPDERVEVEAHLAACSECARLVAEMEGVDEAVRAMPVEAPSGYFDQLPGRVRSRIESEDAKRAAATPAPARGRVPAWTWAAAAALLLAVITPLTLERPERAAPPRLDEAAPARRDARPHSSAPMEEDQDEAVPARAEGEQEARAGREKEPESPPQKGGERPRPAFAAAPAAEPVGAAASRGQEATAADAEEKPPPAASVAAEIARPEVETPVVLDDAPEVAAAPLEESRAAARLERRQEAFAGTQKEALSEDSRDYARLAGVPPSGAAAWRERREAWRSFLDTHPGSRYADEARVRMIEAGLQAWKAGADPEDLARARVDARAYLARDDARQKDRVRQAFAEIEGG
jgi:hypothetical protein